MGLNKSKLTVLKDNHKDLNELEINYLYLEKRAMRSLYLSVQNNPFNKDIALKKKQFNKVSTIKNRLRVNNKTSSVLYWKDYLLKYFKNQKDQGLLWYSDIINKINDHIFLDENNYLSLMFYQGYEIDTKPSVLEGNNIEEEAELEVEIGNEKDLNNNFNRKDLVDKLMNNMSNNVTGLSRIDLTKITENLGGSFSSVSKYDYSHIDNRILVKKFVKLFKHHVIDTNHPINQVIQIFEQSLSFVLREKIIVLTRLKDNEDEEFDNIINGLCEEIVSQIQKFVIKAQSALKLFYTEALNLQCLIEEKDELVNLISGILFKTGTLYDMLYQLFSMKMSKEIFQFEQKIIILSKITPTDLNINAKFSLDDSTQQLIDEIVKHHNDKESSADISLNSAENNINNVNSRNTNNNQSNVNYKILVSTSQQIKIRKAFHNKNPIKEYTTAIKIIRSVKYTNDPFEKMMLIASIGSEVISCVNSFWKGMDPYIPLSFLTLSPDDLVGIFIYLIIKAEMPEILIHEKIIKEFTTSTTQISLMGYYYTTLQGAIEYIRKNNLYQKAL